MNEPDYKAFDRLYGAALKAGLDTPDGRLLEAMADSAVPPPPPIDRDPVAIRLGLVSDRCSWPREVKA